MKNIDSKDFITNVPLETTTFLIIVIIFTFLLFVIFIILNKKWKVFHISETIENKLNKNRLGNIKIQSFESSSDSEKEDISKYIKNNKHIPPDSCSSNLSCNELEKNLIQLQQQQQHQQQQHDKYNEHYKQNYYCNVRPLNVTMCKEKKNYTNLFTNGGYSHKENSSQSPNLMSMVENGSLYETVSSSSSEYINEIEKQNIIKNNSVKKFNNESSCRSTHFIRTKSIDSESPPPSEQECMMMMESMDDHCFEEEISMEDEINSNHPSPCGRLEITFDYELLLNTITLHVIQGNNIPSKDVGGGNNIQIRVLLLPSRKQKFKTKIRSGENPQFMESFIFNKIKYENLNKYSIRFRLYGCERLRRKKLLGEYILNFNSINIELESTLWINFQPKYFFNWDSHSESGSLARSESNSSTQSIQSGIPELLLGLGYNGTTGRLTVEAIKASHLRNLTGGKAPDSYIKLVLIDSTGQELEREKSSLRRSQSNPLFKETFIFQISLFQISEITLLVSLYGRKGVTRRELLGWFSMGYNNTSEEETSHWEDMYNNVHGNQICRWHIFLKS